MSKGLSASFKKEFLDDNKVVTAPVLLAAKIVEYLRAFEEKNDVEIFFDAEKVDSKIANLNICINHESGLASVKIPVDMRCMAQCFSASIGKGISFYALVALLIGHEGFIPLKTMKSLVFFADGLIYYEAGLSMFANSLDPDHSFSSIFRAVVD